MGPRQQSLLNLRVDGIRGTHERRERLVNELEVVERDGFMIYNGVSAPPSIA